MSKLYVLVRGDLSRSQQAVQSCHATAEFMLHNDCWKNHTIVLLRLEDNDHLNEWNQRVAEHRIPFEIFYEPDIGEHTAIACYPDGKLHNYLKHLPLL